MSQQELLRIGVVGASTMLGRELLEGIADSIFASASLVLLDEEEADGKVIAAGDEPAFVRRLNDEAFDKLDLVFFAGSPALAKLHWQAARRAGAAIVDLSYALETEAEVRVLAPWVTSKEPNATAAGSESVKMVVPAHPAAWMLALVASRLRAKLALKSIAATVLEPASEAGRAGMDELHEQTVSLLSFKALPREQYDAQVTFNLLTSLGAAAKVDLSEIAARIERHYGLVVEEVEGLDKAAELALQLIQAPVYHGYTASVLIEFSDQTTEQEIETALSGSPIEVVAAGEDSPNNINVAGLQKVLVQVRRISSTASGHTIGAHRFWLWMAADNLKLAVINAIACASEMKPQRGAARVQ